MKKVKLLLLLIAISIRAFATIDFGKCGPNLTWELTDDSTLIISGSGKMYNYFYSSIPWYNHAKQIKKISISNSVTSIGNSAFYDCSGLTSATIPNSVTSIGSYAFSGCM